MLVKDMEKMGVNFICDIEMILLKGYRSGASWEQVRMEIEEYVMKINELEQDEEEFRMSCRSSKVIS